MFTYKGSCDFSTLVAFSQAFTNQFDINDQRVSTPPADMIIISYFSGGPRREALDSTGTSVEKADKTFTVTGMGLWRCYSAETVVAKFFWESVSGNKLTASRLEDGTFELTLEETEKSYNEWGSCQYRHFLQERLGVSMTPVGEIPQQEHKEDGSSPQEPIQVGGTYEDLPSMAPPILIAK